MLLRLANRLQAWLWARTYKRWARLSAVLWPDADTRAHVLIAQGSELMEVLATGEGAVVEQVSVEPSDDGGYYIDVHRSDEEPVE